MSKPIECLDFMKAHGRALFKSLFVKNLKLRSSLAISKIVLIFVAKDEHNRLPFFLNYYRNIGVESFIAVDNGSIDGSLEFLLQQSDVSVFTSKDSYAGSRYGNDWVNGILNRFCPGKWVLYVDPDEFLQYPHIENKSLQELVKLFERKSIKSLHCTMIDMYSATTIANTYVKIGQNPVDVCNFFDGRGYHERTEKETKTKWIKGGSRGRVFFSENVWKGPALNKTPLVKWRLGYAFLKSSHQLLPYKLNNANPMEQRLVTGVLMHFKMISSMPAKIFQQDTSDEHTDEYDMYKVNNLEDINLRSELDSIKFTDWHDFAKVNLMEGQGWTDQ